MKYLVLLAAVAMQMCLGATYSWSVYVQELKHLLDIQQGTAQIPFTIFYSVFPVTVMVAGRLLPKIGTRLAAVLGGVLFGSGWLVASYGAQNYLYTCLGIGVLSGIGAGMAYIVPITVCIRWFPDNKGLVTGVAVAGFGGGAALVSKLGGLLIVSYDKTPFEVFFILGTVFAIVAGVAGSIMHFPSHISLQEIQKTKLRLQDLLKDPCFRLLYLCMFVSLAAGFAINANLKEIFQGADALQVGITAVAIFAIANGLGRVLWGAFYDRLKNVELVLSLNMLCQAVTMVFIPVLSLSATGFLLLAFLVGFNYGGVLVIYVSSVTKHWGSHHVGQVYGVLFTSNLPAALFPIIVGMIYDLTGTFSLAWYSFTFLLCVCIFVVVRKKGVFISYETSNLVVSQKRR